MQRFDPASPDPTDLDRPLGLMADPWSAVHEDEEEQSQESWLLNYVDVLMLLLTLLVVLLVLQRQEGLLGKWMEEVAIPVVAQPSVAAVPVEAPMAGSAPVAKPQVDQPLTDGQFTSGEEPMDEHSLWLTPDEQLALELADEIGLEPLQEVLLVDAADLAEPASETRQQRPTGADQVGNEAQALADVLAWNGLTDGLQIVATDRQLRMETLDDILFAPASTVLTERGETLLGDLADVLRLHPGELSVEGHADNRPIHNENFPSNWELSSARAGRVVRFLVEHGLDAQRLRAIGYSDTRPKADNNTEAGRSNNRRVTLVLELAPLKRHTAQR